MLVLLPILALIFLAWAPSPAATPRLRQLILPALALGVVLLIFSRIFPDRWTYPEARSMGITEFAIDRFRNEAKPGKPIIIMEGSSLTFYGISGILLQSLLEVEGLSATVLQFSSPGANHYERRKMFTEFLGALSPEEREMLKTSRVLLLREVLTQYDENPVYYLEGKTLNRSVFYTDAASFPKIWRTGSLRPDAITFHWDLIKSTTLHEFGVGIFSRFELPHPPDKVQPYGGIGWKNPGRFSFSESWSEFAEAYTRGEEIQGAPEGVPHEAWRDATRDLRDEIDSYVDVIGYFAPPVLSASEFRYQKAFMNALPPGQPSFGPPDRELFKQLSEADLWFDEKHTTYKGATLVTGWLAGLLTAQWDSIFAP